MMPPGGATALVGLWLACSAPVFAASDAGDSADAAALRRAIDREIGDADCEADEQCHGIAVGTPACGGGEVYLAWSEKVTNRATLEDLAARQRAAQALANRHRPMRTDCVLSTQRCAACRSRAGDGKRVCQMEADRDLDVR